MTLKFDELKDYRGERAQRGAVLSRGWRKVDRLEVESARAWPRDSARQACPTRSRPLRLIDEVALDELDAELPQHRHGVGVFDALGDRARPSCAFA